MEAIGHLDDQDLGIWDGGVVLEVLNSIGLDQALALDQIEGIVGNFDADHIQPLGDNLGNVLGHLYFTAGAAVLEDFSFGMLSVLPGEEVQDLDVAHLVGLTNTTGGDAIIGLSAEPLETIVGNLEAEFFAELDPSVVGGLFAGLDSEQIVDFAEDSLQAALEISGANLLSGLGDFNSIVGGDTSFDLLADFVDSEFALEQNGEGIVQEEAVSLFGDGLFGSN